jgi:glutaredoxin-like protein NrdH
MFDYLEYTHEEGTVRDRNVTVYALSTCGFCRRGLQFLRDHSIDFSFVYVDDLPIEVKTKVKKELHSQYKKDVSFPFVVIDDKDTLVGFIEPDWKQTFKVG